MKWPVVKDDDRGIRASKPGVCYYCDQKVGDPHGKECVSVTKRVRSQFTITLDLLEPVSWDADYIEFRYNNGSFCMDNLLPTLEALSKRDGCLCNHIEAKVLHIFGSEVFTLDDHLAPPLPLQSSGWGRVWVRPFEVPLSLDNREVWDTVANRFALTLYEMLLASDATGEGRMELHAQRWRGGESVLLVAVEFSDAQVEAAKANRQVVLLELLQHFQYQAFFQLEAACHAFNQRGGLQSIRVQGLEA
jgi:hypothetical protein